MRINHTLTYPTTPNDLVAVLSNEDFMVSRFTKLGLTPEISISELPTNSPSSVTTLPVSAEATSTLSADGAHTQRELQGQISVNIPFFGRKVESLLARYVTDAAQAEVDSVRQWIVR